MFSFNLRQAFSAGAAGVLGAAIAVDLAAHQLKAAAFLGLLALVNVIARAIERVGRRSADFGVTQEPRMPAPAHEGAYLNNICPADPDGREDASETGVRLTAGNLNEEPQ
jgi:hypothetical protein